MTSIVSPKQDQSSLRQGHGNEVVKGTLIPLRTKAEVLASTETSKGTNKTVLKYSSDYYKHRHTSLKYQTDLQTDCLPCYEMLFPPR
jgi:hypothetical protein